MRLQGINNGSNFWTLQFIYINVKDFADFATTICYYVFCLPGWDRIPQKSPYTIDLHVIQIILFASNE